MVSICVSMAVVDCSSVESDCGLLGAGGEQGADVAQDGAAGRARGQAFGDRGAAGAPRATHLLRAGRRDSNGRRCHAESLVARQVGALPRA